MGINIADAQKAVSALHDAQLSFDEGSRASTQIAASDVPPFAHARQVLRFSRGARSLQPASQIWVARWLELEAQGQFLQTEVSDAAAFGDRTQRLEAAQAMAAHKKKVRDLQESAPTAAWEFMDVYRLMVGLFAWSTWALPLQVSGSASNRELTEISDKYERLRSAMYRPLSKLGNAPASTVRRWRRAWNIYEDCGIAFGLIGTWLRAMAATGEARRCQVCYRHLASGMKRFCALHQRTAETRQDSRELHVSSIYGAVLQRRIAKNSVLSTIAPPANSEIHEMALRAKAAGICNELAWPAGGLAASLRALYPLMAPSARTHLQRVFVRVFSIAQEPFEQEGVQTYEAQLRRTWQQREAPQLFAPSSFFRALYGAPYAVNWAAHRTLGAGLDIDHPLAHGETALPNRLALDLVHLPTWLEVDDLFDEFAYLNPLYLKRLREGDSLAGIQPMSFAQISRFLGVSAEAVRQTLRHADGLEGTHERRQRAIPSRLAELKAHLLSAKPE